MATRLTRVLILWLAVMTSLPAARAALLRGEVHVWEQQEITLQAARAMLDEAGRSVDEAGPSIPVEIQGLASVPSAGDEFRVFADERDARNLAEDRAMKVRLAAQNKKSHVSLDDLFARISEGARTKQRCSRSQRSSGMPRTLSAAQMPSAARSRRNFATKPS